MQYLHDGIHWARLLTEAAVDALGHIDVVSSGPSAAVSPGLGLYSDGLCWTHSLAQLACNAPLLPIGVPPQGVFPSEPWADGTLLKGIVQGDRLSEEGTQCDGQAYKDIVGMADHAWYNEL